MTYLMQGVVWLPAEAEEPGSLKLGTFGNRKGIVDFDTETPDCASKHHGRRL